MFNDNTEPEVYEMEEINKDSHLYNIMHKYGKLSSCNSNKPGKVDELFLEELKEMLKND